MYTYSKINVEQKNKLKLYHSNIKKNFCFKLRKKVFTFIKEQKRNYTFR